MMKPDEIEAWSAEFREGSQGELQVNLWIPDVPPTRDFELEKRQREFLAMWDRLFRRDGAMQCYRTCAHISICCWRESPAAGAQSAGAKPQKKFWGRYR